MQNQPIIMKDWDAFYGGIGGQWAPAEDIVRFCSRHIRVRATHNRWVEKRAVEHILDLGCGSGRHVVYFAEQGLNISGIDISQNAVDMTKHWLTDRSLTAAVEVASAAELPFPDAHFDVVVSFGVLDHMLQPLAQKAIHEARRVLKPGGLLHLNLRSPKSYDYGKGEQLEPGTYVITEGPEKGLEQHFWTEEEVAAAFDGFKILNWELLTRWLNKEQTLCDSRWAVSAQKP